MRVCEARPAADVVAAAGGSWARAAAFASSHLLHLLALCKRNRNHCTCPCFTPMFKTHCPTLAHAAVLPGPADNTWRLLESAIHEINSHNASGLSFEELYRRGRGGAQSAWPRGRPRLAHAWHHACLPSPLTAPASFFTPGPQECLQHGGQQVRRPAVPGPGGDGDAAPERGGRGLCSVPLVLVLSASTRRRGLWLPLGGQLGP